MYLCLKNYWFLCESCAFFSIGLHKIKLTERRNNPFNFFFFFLINIIQYDYAVYMKITPFRKREREICAYVRSITRADRLQSHTQLMRSHVCNAWTNFFFLSEGKRAIKWQVWACYLNERKEFSHWLVHYFVRKLHEK